MASFVMNEKEVMMQKEKIINIILVLVISTGCSRGGGDSSGSHSAVGTPAVGTPAVGTPVVETPAVRTSTAGVLKVSSPTTSIMNGAISQINLSSHTDFYAVPNIQGGVAIGISHQIYFCKEAKDIIAKNCDSYKMHGQMITIPNEYPIVILNDGLLMNDQSGKNTIKCSYSSSDCESISEVIKKIEITPPDRAIPKVQISKAGIVVQGYKDEFKTNILQLNMKVQQITQNPEKIKTLETFKTKNKNYEFKKYKINEKYWMYISKTNFLVQNRATCKQIGGKDALNYLQKCANNQKIQCFGWAFSNRNGNLYYRPIIASSLDFIKPDQENASSLVRQNLDEYTRCENPENKVFSRICCQDAGGSEIYIFKEKN